MQSVARILRAHATCFLEFFHEQLKGKMQHIAGRSVYLPRVTVDARCMDVEVNVDAILRARGDARHGARPDNASLRIVLLDEQTLSRQAMKSLLLQNRRVQCVLDVSTIDECVSVATQQGARVIILSLDGDQGDRVQQVRTLASKVSGAHVLAIGHDIEPSRLLAIIGAGAVGFVATTANENELGDAIEEVASGGISVDGLTTTTALERSSRVYRSASVRCYVSSRAASVGHRSLSSCASRPRRSIRIDTASTRSWAFGTVRSM